MPRVARLSLILVAVIALAATFVALRPTDEDTSTPVVTQAVTTAPEPPSDGSPGATAAPAATPEPTPAPEIVEVKGLEPVGGVQRLRAKQGEDVRFVVRSDRGENAHLHGYDIETPVGPGRDARFAFEAKITGIFELELENSAVPIAELRVDP
ncbi:hypothetical protein [Paraconexibacter algicola]|uniref:Uncharacterized protein n=1 Tax=Paraconexibacter algicola TaxID=2133960 RepID=A0A2T4UM55_9ACTN|nr:hypothetical protein [Paraconexibacter algicola]PTL60322.1 hypothetical protein C7Y72_12075 [Paraconexibacter algicola]